MSNQKISVEDKVKRIYTWAAQNTAETRLAEYKYFWPPAVKTLLNSLKLSRGSVNTVVALSGVGKSTALRHITWSLEEEVDKDGEKTRVVYFKWPGGIEPFQALGEILEEEGFNPRDELVDELQSKLSADNPKARTYVEGLEEMNTKQLWSFFKIGERKELSKRFIIDYLSTLHTILVDSRDYSRSDRRQMNTDIMGVQMLWQKIQEAVEPYEGSMPNLVFTIQKEMFYSEGSFSHYFLGKSRVFEIQPFPAFDLVEAFKIEFEAGVWKPFIDEAALQYLAKMSRGIFRRFLRYIQLALEQFMAGKTDVLDLALAQQAVTPEEMERDWELELRQIFPHGDRWREALGIITRLVKEGPTLQKALAWEIEIGEGWKRLLSEAQVTRLLYKLEEYGYVKRYQTAEGKMVAANV